MTITCIYSSGGGNTRLVVESVQSLLGPAGYEMDIVNAHVATPEDFLRSEITLLACPTYDHGVLHMPFAKLLFKADDIDCSGHHYAIIGLGDDKYDKEYNVASADVLESFVRSHDGSILLPSLRVNKHPLHSIENSLEQWVTSFISLLKKHG